MEQEHAIPQQISSYQFRLVGDMTIKQFFQIAAGILIALLIYSSSLPVYIKWPLMLVAFLFGIALAFFPVEDRPLSRWIVLFFKSIYSPTLYEWQKNYQKPYYFQDDLPAALAQAQPNAQNTALNTPTPETATEAVEVVHSNPSAVSLENTERIFLDKVKEHLSDTIQVAHDTEPHPSPAGTPIAVPQTQNVQVVSPVNAPDKSIDMTVRDVERVTQTSQVTPISGTVMENTQAAQFSIDASPPIPPTQPNVVVGQVITKDGKIVENAIIEIRDSEGRPVRALKSNKLGHFMIVTPLANGSYQLITEKDGYTFNTVTVSLTGTIIQPLVVSSN